MASNSGFTTRRRAIAGAVVLGATLLAGRLTRAFTYLTTGPAGAPPAPWQDLGLAPGGENRYPPQGMVHVDDRLYVTNHWHEEASALYRVDPETGDVEDSQLMPEPATHTSGLAWDGRWLWAVDHQSNRLYQLDPATLFESEVVPVEHAYPTGLLASSGLTALTVDDTTYLAISDFVWSIQAPIPLPTGTSRTYVVPLDRVPELEEHAVPEVAVVSYANGGYSQGLTFDGQYLYESTNNRGLDSVSVLDIAPAVRGTAEVDRLDRFAGPGTRIEDLGTDGERLWTSDEASYHLYRMDSLGAVRDRIG